MTNEKDIYVEITPRVDLENIQFRTISTERMEVEVDADLPSKVDMSYWVNPVLKSTYKSINYLLKHSFYLQDLMLDTTYNYSLTLTDTSGFQKTYKDSSFQTVLDQWFTPGVETNLVVYPNPYRPARGHNFVIFDNLPREISAISVFTPSGDLVYEEEMFGVPARRWQWTVVNNKGKKLASGFYIYIIKGDDGKKIKSGKLAIIR